MFRRACLSVLTFSLMSLFSFCTTPASACSANCSTEIGCYGGCSISAPSGCGELCYGSCTVTCSLIGPRGCDTFVSETCQFKPPPESPVVDGIERPQLKLDWAVVEYETRPVGPIGLGDARSLSASSAEFGNFARGRVVEQANETLSVRREGTVNQKDQRTGDAVGQLQHSQRRIGLVIDTAGGDPVKVGAELLSRDFPLAVGRENGIFFRAVTDGTGRVEEVQTLYSLDSQLTEQFERFVRENLTVTATESAWQPVLFYGRIGVGGPEMELWYALAGAIARPEDLPALEAVGGATRQTAR